MYITDLINFMRSVFVSHWSIVPNMTFIHYIVFKILSKINGPRNIGHWPTYHEINLCVTLIHYHTWHSSIKYSSRYKAKSLDHEIQVTVTYIYFEVKHGVILIIPNDGVHTSNSLQDIRQNNWTMKYRSCWPSLHDQQVNGIWLRHVWPTICKSCFHSRKIEKLFKGGVDFDL